MTCLTIRPTTSSDDIQCLAQLARSEDGQDVAEYGLLTATVGVLVLVATTSLGANLQTWFMALAAEITSFVGG